MRSANPNLIFSREEESNEESFDLEEILDLYKNGFDERSQLINPFKPFDMDHGTTSQYNDRQTLENHSQPNRLIDLAMKIYQTKDDLLDHVRKITCSQGYATTIKRKSKKDKLVIIGCDRGGTYRGTNPISQKKST